MEQEKYNDNAGIAGFELIKQDGTREYIADGILYKSSGRQLKVYVHTCEASVIFASGESISRVIGSLGVPLWIKLKYLSRVFMRVMGWLK